VPPELSLAIQEPAVTKPTLVVPIPFGCVLGRATLDELIQFISRSTEPCVAKTRAVLVVVGKTEDDEECHEFLYLSNQFEQAFKAKRRSNLFIKKLYLLCLLKLSQSPCERLQR